MNLLNKLSNLFIIKLSKHYQKKINKLKFKLDHSQKSFRNLKDNYNSLKADFFDTKLYREEQAKQFRARIGELEEENLKLRQEIYQNEKNQSISLHA